MNTSTTPRPNTHSSSHTHTPLETLLLFRGVAKYGLETGLDHDNFVRVSELLNSNKLVKSSATYDAQRLSPDTLRDLFFRLVRNELRSESENIPGLDGPLSPASKKRRLHSPPLLSLKDLGHHVEKIEAAYVKAHDAYLLHAIEEIRQYEQEYDSLLREIGDLELSVRESEKETKPQSPNGAQVTGKHEAGPNGVSPSPVASPRPPIPSPHATPQHPLRTLQPLLPHPAQQDARNGLSPTQQAAPERASPAPRSPAPGYPEAARSPQIGQQEPAKVPVARPTATPKPPNGAPQVLQAPQGVTPFQPPQSPAAATAADGLQRPEGAPEPRHSPALPLTNAQASAQGQLKWEPPYQPNAPPRQTPVANVNQHLPNVFTQPHGMPPHRPPQHQSPHPSPAPSQAQPSRPFPQQVLIPPHSTSQFAPALQSPPVRSPADLTGGPGPNRQQPLPSVPAANNAQIQAPYHPQYQGHVPTPGQAAPAQPAQAAQASPAPVHPGPVRSPAIPSTAAPPVAIPPRPSPGLAAPQPRPQPSNLQHPQYNQQHVPKTAPSLAPAHPDAAQRYSSPYQPPRPAAVDRIHPRLPAAATPTPVARFSPAPPAPRTPVMTLPARLAGGSGTKWVSTSTPSTPKLGVEFRLGYDDVPSPAYEPTSPVLRPAVPVAKEAQRRGSLAETPKSKPGRPHGPQRAQGPSSTTQPTGQQAKEARAAEPAAPKVKDEATTPRPTTETGDTTADESVTGRPQPPRSTKRKREDLTPTPVQTPRTASQLRDVAPVAPADPPHLVLWTRSFNKVCGSAMEQIIHHRSANMFAAPIREKDAPGYHKVVKQPQDLKSIRAAINHGNRAAGHAAAALPDGGDPGTSSVWLPRTEDLVPPKSIINSSQLDRELAHMFSNAIMYNPDPYHGPGPAFVRDEEGEGEAGDDDDHHHHQQDSGVLGYKVDEFGVVNDARGMFVEVEKLLSELRSAEVRRGVPPGLGGGVGVGGGGGGTGTGTSTRQASVLGQGGGGGGGNEEEEGDDGEGQGQEEEGVGGAVKRRRVARG